MMMKDGTVGGDNWPTDSNRCGCWIRFAGPLQMSISNLKMKLMIMIDGDDDDDKDKDNASKQQRSDRCPSPPARKKQSTSSRVVS